MANRKLSSGMLRGRSWWGVVAGLVLGCSDPDSEPRTCTLIGCNEELTIELKAEEWVPGQYVVSITDSQRSYDCRFEKLPDGTGGQAGAQSNESWGVAQGCKQTAGATAASWDAPEFVGLGEAVTIRSRYPAERVPLTVRRDGVTLLDVELTPSYTKSYPNGFECDASAPCLNGSETLTLPADGA